MEEGKNEIKRLIKRALLFQVIAFACFSISVVAQTAVVIVLVTNR
jgi:hypothetical protein